MSNSTEGEEQQDNHFGSPVLGAADDDPRRRQPESSHGIQTPSFRMGPPLRSLAHDANDCIMVGLARGYRIQGCIAARRRAAMAGFPFDCHESP